MEPIRNFMSPTPKGVISINQASAIVFYTTSCINIFINYLTKVSFTIPTLVVKIKAHIGRLSGWKNFQELSAATTLVDVGH